MVSLRAHLAGRRLCAAAAWSCVFQLLTRAWGAGTPGSDAALDAWFAAQTKLQTWSAEFTETRTFRALSQPLQSTGQVWVAMPDRFRWELGRPAQTIVVRQQNELVIVYPRLERAERYPLDAAEPRPWKDAMSLLDAGLPRNRSELESRFQIRSVTASEGVWRITLQPKSAQTRRLMPEIRVELSTNDFSLRANEVVFTDGSKMRDEFRSPQVNQPVDAGLFTPPIGPGFKVTTAGP